MTFADGQAHRAGKTKDQIVAGLGIFRELFNRVMRSGLAIKPMQTETPLMYMST
ncbi:MAG: hypothetical protein WCH43_15930 [Verrucomicrobiota bacterium]